MFMKELYLVGTSKEIEQTEFFLENLLNQEGKSREQLLETLCVLTKYARKTQNIKKFLKYVVKANAIMECSEICSELGLYYEEQEDFQEAIIWYYNARYETTPILALKTNEGIPLNGLIRCYEKIGILEQSNMYRDELEKINLEG